MARARAFIGRAFVGELVGLKKIADGIHEVYRFPSHRLALRPRSGRNAAGLHCPSSLMLSACPPLESERAAWRRAPEQTAAPPSSYLASLFRRAPSRPTAKVSPMSLDQTVTHVIRLSQARAPFGALAEILQRPPALMKCNVRKKDLRSKRRLTKSSQSRGRDCQHARRVRSPEVWRRNVAFIRCFIIRMKRFLILHVVRRVTRCDGAWRDKFRFGRKSDERARGRSSPAARDR